MLAGWNLFLCALYFFCWSFLSLSIFWPGTVFCLWPISSVCVEQCQVVKDRRTFNNWGRYAVSAIATSNSYPCCCETLFSVTIPKAMMSNVSFLSTFEHMPSKQGFPTIHCAGHFLSQRGQIYFWDAKSPPYPGLCGNPPEHNGGQRVSVGSGQNFVANCHGWKQPFISKSSHRPIFLRNFYTSKGSRSSLLTHANR